jgi:hypothetical protein
MHISRLPGSVSASSQPLEDSPPARIGGTLFPDGNDTMPVLLQGHSNACGTTALAMILGYLTGAPVDRRDIDAQIRRFDVFSAPLDLIEYARRSGLAAEGYNHGTRDELLRFIEGGIPCVLVISADGSHHLADLHCVVPVAHHPDPATGEELFTLHDPARGKVDVPWSELDRLWSGARVGFDHLLIAVGRAGTTLPPGRDSGVHGTLVASQGLAAVMNAVERLIHPHDADPRPGLAALERGALQAVSGAVEEGAAALASQIRRLFA